MSKDIIFVEVECWLGQCEQELFCGQRISPHALVRFSSNLTIILMIVRLYLTYPLLTKERNADINK